MQISVLCQGGGHARCLWGLLPNATSQGHVKMQYINCILSHFAFLFQKPLLLGDKLFFKKNPHHYDQLGGSEREERELELNLHVPSYQKIEHGLPCNKVFCLFKFCSVLSRKGVLPLFEIFKNFTCIHKLVSTLY